MSRRTAKIRALTGLVHAQARQVEAEVGKAQVELDTRRFDDMVTQRDRFTVVLQRAREERAVQVFEYRRLLQPHFIDGGSPPNRSGS